MTTSPALAAERPDEVGALDRPSTIGFTASRRFEFLAVAALFIALAYVVLFWRLGTPTFWDPDEAHYAETTREMIATGDWWAPHYNDQPFFDKPALFHQLQGLSMLAFGETEFGARFVPAIAALGLVLVTLWFGATMTSREIGAVASLLLLTSPGVFALARYAILDTLFTFFLFLGASTLAAAALLDRPPLQWIGYVAIGGAVLVKGPLALVLCGLTFLIAVTCSQELRRRLFALRLTIGLAIIAIISLPWFIYMYSRFGQAFVNGYLFEENLRLYAGARFGNQPGFWFYFRILAAGLLPWTGVLVGRACDDLRALVKRDPIDSVEVLLWAWTAAIVAFFSFSTFKLDHYVFPAAPALCLLVARARADVRATPYAPRHAATRVGIHLVGPMLVALGLGGGYFLIARLELPLMAIVVPAALTVAGATLTAMENIRGGRPPAVPFVTLIAVLITYGGIIAFVMPALEHRKVADDVARYAAAEAAGGQRVATYRMDRWNAVSRFYVGRHVTFLEDPVQAEQFFSAPEPFFCIMRRAAFDEFVARGVPLRIVYEREGMWATSGRALWRQRLPLTRLVLATRGEP